MTKRLALALVAVAALFALSGAPASAQDGPAISVDPEFVEAPGEQEFTIVEVNTWGFGQAPPGLIFITKEAFNSTASDVARFFSAGLNDTRQISAILS